MWTDVYGRNGDIVKGGWAMFQHELRREHEPVVKVEMLNASLTPVGDFILTSGIDPENQVCNCPLHNGSFTNVVSDGNIDVDVERGTRRTGELTILNPEADFTPATKDFDPEGPWVGKLYLNRNIRVWRGVRHGDLELYVPVGTFMIDVAEVIMENNMSLVNLTMSDHWKKLQKSFMGFNKTYEKGTNYNAIIKDLLGAAGVPLTGKYRAVLDRFPERTTAEKQTDRKVKLNRGDSRGDVLKELAKDWGIDVYFDPMGIFRSEDRRESEDKKTVWKWGSQQQDESGRHGGIVSLTRSFNDDNLYNHVIIIGTGNEKQTVKATRKDTNPRSKTNVSIIGDRVFLKESERISTQAQANKALRRIWQRRFQLSEEITAEVVCNPALEADDVIKITERDFVKVDGRYRLRRFNVPLVTTRQTIEAANIIRGDDLS